MKTLKVLFLFFVLLPAGARAADTSWLEQAGDCRSFERGVTQFYAELAGKEELTERDKKDIDLVLAQACGEKLGRCRFSICQDMKPSSAAAPAELISDSQSSASTPAPHLSWIKESMNCDQFRAEFKKRYSAMSGRFSELSESEKRELNDALTMACTERFEKCHVSACVPKVQSKEQSSSAAVKPQGDSELQRMYERREKERKAAIAAKVEEEQRNGVKWKPFSISD